MVPQGLQNLISKGTEPVRQSPLMEGNDSLPPRVYDDVTRGLTAKKPRSARSPTLVIEYGTTLVYHYRQW